MGKLLYLYIGNVGKIKEQEFYFSDDYLVKFDSQSNCIFLEKNEENKRYCGFYGDNISDVKMIVGPNGSGKTTILELLGLPTSNYKRKHSTSWYKNLQWFAITELDKKDGLFRVEGEGYWWNNSNKQHYRNVKTFKINKENGILEEFDLEDNNELFTRKYRKINEGMNDYSNENSDDNQRGIQLFKAASLYDIYQFLKNDFSEYTGGNILGVRGITITLDDKGVDVEKKKKCSNKEIFLLGLLVDTLDRLVFYWNAKEKINVLKKIWDSEKRGLKPKISIVTEKDIEDMFNDTGVKASIPNVYDVKIPHEEFSCFLNNIGNNGVKQFFQIYCEDLVFCDKSLNLVNEDKRKLFDEVISYYCDRVRQYSSLPEEYFVAEDEIRFVINNQNIRYLQLLNYVISYKQASYLETTDDDLSLEPILRAEIDGFSTGELAYIQLFSSLNSNLRGVISGESITIMLDEPDNTMHPEWSRNFLYNLTHFLSNYDFEIQIIITTHSPLMISDLLKKDVIIINKDGESIKSKYGWMSNIHDIIRETFCLTSSFGELGKYNVNRKIINNNNRDEAAKFIDQITDPMLQRLLRKKN